MTAKQLQKLRHAAGLSTKELGEKLGVSQRTIENWEQGRYKIAAAVVKLLELQGYKV